jgi:hypothetical protein
VLDETIITEIQPLCSCCGRLVELIRIPMTGNRKNALFMLSSMFEQVV